MAIIESISAQTFSTQSMTPASAKSSPFAGIMNQALTETTAAESAVNAENATLLTGSNTNIHSVVLAAEKAEVALRLTLQIRNKVMDAYNEIMRMQI